MYKFLKQIGFQGSEIALTRLWKENPYRYLNEADNIKKEYMKNMDYIFHHCSLFGMEDVKILFWLSP